jgi:serine/threonine protein kinase
MKGTSSDGRSSDELALYAAVFHPHLIRVHGILHSDSFKAVVMQRLVGVHDLAGPPTIKEVTADVWRPWQVFSRSFVLEVLTSLCSALTYLHGELGVSHGDVYAHNTLVTDDASQIYLADFGAAFRYCTPASSAASSPSSPPSSTNLDPFLIQRLEVRAFGVLVDELQSRLDLSSSSSSSFQESLRKMAQNCLDDDVAKRPSFKTLGIALSQLDLAN